jgi:Ferritin-like domain
MPLESAAVHNDGHEGSTRPGVSRRLALIGIAAMAGTGVATVAASHAAAQTDTTGPAGSAPTGTAASTTTTTLPPKLPTPTDVALLGFGQSLELAAAQLYDQAVPTLTGDVADVATAFRAHHQSYAEQLGGLLGRRAPGVANRTLVQERTAAFGARSVPAIVRAMYQLEISLAASYSAVLGQLKGTDGAALVASIQPIEARHAVVWGQNLGLPDEDLMPLLEGDEPDATLLTPSLYPIV